MRRSEICNLKWHNVDLGNCLLKIDDTKNGDARHIPLTSAAVYIFKNTPKESELVFNTTGNAMRLAWGKFRNKFSFEFLRFHDLRHEAISKFFETGLTVPEITLISGHKTVSELFKYAHADLRKLTSKIQELEQITTGKM